MPVYPGALLFTDDSGAIHLDASRNAACGHCGGYSLIGSCHAAVRDPYLCPHKPQTQRAREKQMPSPFTCRQRCQRGMQSVIRLCREIQERARESSAVRAPAIKSQADVIVVTSSIPNLRVALAHRPRTIVRICGEKASDDDSSARAKRILRPRHEQGADVGCQRPVRLGRNSSWRTLT